MKPVTSSRSASIRRASGSFRPIALAVALAFALPAGPALANPVGPSVAAGVASFATQGGSLSIVNSPGTIINWQGFSIGAAEATRFIQQGTSSSVLNRVVGFDPSVILGTLSSNGRVFLINPSGILVGQAARMDVAGLVASTLNLSNQDFLAGRLNFMLNPLAGGIDNRGIITTPSGGSVYLVGANVTNSGVINSPQGDVILAAGQSVKIYDTGTPGVRVEIAAGENAAVNLGDILAHSGQIGIYGAVLRNAGLIDADQAVRDASGRIVLRATRDVTLEAGSRISASGAQGGEIAVQSETGTTLVSGTIAARGSDAAAGKGGNVQLLGNRVGLLAANVDVSGRTGGGTVLIGGDYQGRNASVQNASATYVSPDASIKADAIGEGNGGRVIVWADDVTRFHGDIEARGGPLGGDGGFTEVSGKGSLVFGGNVDLRAPGGRTGTLLLDPLNITIQGAGPDLHGNATLLDLSTANIFFADDPGVTSIITSGAVVTQLGTANVTLQATNDINVLAAIDASAKVGGKSLALQAGHDVIIGAALTSTAGGALILNAGNDIRVNAALTASGTGTAIDLSAGHDVIVGAGLTANGVSGSVILRADNDGTGPGAAAGTVTFSAGAVTATGNVTIRFNPAGYSNTSAEILAYLGSSTVTGAFDARAWTFVDNSSAVALSKPYDGTTTAALDMPFAFKSGPDGSPGQVVSLVAGAANFNSKNVTATTVNFTGYGLSGGGDSANYALFAQPANQLQSITQKNVTISGTTANDKVYNGDTVATLSAIGTVDTGVVGEALVLTGPTAGNINFDTKDVATAGLVTGTGYAIGDGVGGSMANYTLTSTTATAAANITKAGLLLTGTQVYNGGTAYAGANLNASGIAGETFAITGTGDATNLASKDVQSGSTLASLTGLALGAGNAGTTLATNYNVITTVGSLVDVTARPVTLTAPSVTKTYDGGTTYTATGADLTAIGASAPLVGGDTITAANIAYTNRDFGLGDKTVTLSGSTISDGNSGANYNILAQNGNLTSTINKAALTVAANPQNKVYGTIDPALTYTTGAFQFGDTAGSVLTGVLSRAAGEDVNSYAIGQNTLASNANYTIAYTANNLAIASASLNVAANLESKLFGAIDPVLTFSTTGLVNNPALGIADTAVSVLSGALTRVPGESALGGPYPITLGSLAANANYSLGFTPGAFTIIGAAAEPVLGFNAVQITFAGVTNSDYYYRPGNFWHVSLNTDNADPGFDVMRGTNDSNVLRAREGEEQLSGFVGGRRRRVGCDSIYGGGFCETWSFPQQFEKARKK